jgi:hypothetical protein
LHGISWAFLFCSYPPLCAFIQKGWEAIMSNYSKVQFVSWELHTGPFVSPMNNQVGFYSGLCNLTPDHRTDLLGQCWDIDARLLFVADAMGKACALADNSAATLKVFLAPEFLFRGAGGAYLHDLINGWQAGAPTEFGLRGKYADKWGGLFGGLQALANNAKYENWLFVFGTAVSASFPTRKAENGKYLLDPAQYGEIYNSALIQRGGVGHTADNYASRKQYISGIDFIKWYGIPNSTAHTANSVLPADPQALIPADVMGVVEGGSVFTIQNINDGTGNAIPFGIEVCLDHACSGNGANHFGRLRTANQNVKIQLVPSGGMHLIEASIRLLPAAGPTPHSYAFNCDGLGNLGGPARGCHTQIWNGANGGAVAAANKLVEASNGAALAGTQLAAVVNQVATPNGNVTDAALWNNGNGVQGAGHVRVCQPLAI